MNIVSIDLLFLDYLVIIFSIIIIILSFWKGFVNSILGLLTWIGSVFITIYTYEYFSNFLNNLLLNIELLNGFEQFISVISIFISIPLIFLISLLILKRLRKIISSDIDRQILGLIIDKFFGIIYGIIFSYIIFSTLIYFTGNNSIDALNSLNFFIIDNSNILKETSNFNENIIQIYSNNSKE